MPKMILTLCNLHWWCFSFHPLAQILYLHSWWSSCTATCAGGVFPRSTGAFTNVLTTEYAQIATCIVWWWWLLWWWVVLILLRIHMYICHASGMQICFTVCSYLLLPSKMAAAHKWLYSSYPSQWYASRDRSTLCTYF